MMLKIGDAVLHDIYVGVVIGTDGTNIMCACSDGTVKTFLCESAILISGMSDILKSLRGAICNQV